MPPVESSHEENIYMKKIADQVEHYEEMVEFMDVLVKTIDRTLYTIVEHFDKEGKGMEQEVIDCMEKCIMCMMS